jgi:methylmalonyl-CoA mutase
MLTKHDAWSNILRGTASCFAAAIGGADAITILPLTEALGLPTPFARRVARNTQLVLMEECHIGHVIDPAGGAWFVEKLTHDLAEATWAKFQAIEAEGGILAALAGGSLQNDIAAARATRMKAFASRRDAITGVSDFPLLDERAPDFVSYGWKPAQGGEAAVATPDMQAEALPAMRWAEPYERLRDAAAQRTPAPAVFFANLGPLAEFAPRANFARNLFAAGGVAALEPEAIYDHDAARCAAWAASGTPVAVLCGSDERYGADGDAAVRALKAAGCAAIVYAGKPKDEAPWRAAGVTQFVFASQDAIEALSALQRALGIAA